MATRKGKGKPKLCSSDGCGASCGAPVIKEVLQKESEQKENVDIIPFVPDEVEQQIIQVTKKVSKHFIQSKTIWTNIILLVCIMLQQKYDINVSLELQGEIIIIINIILRAFSNSKLTIK